MNELFLNALKCRNRSRPPVWLMRQAGRYMPEYRQLRSKYSFLEMCHQPELIAEVTQLPIQAFGMDAAILFSDILVILEALGVGLRFEEGAGPIIERPITSSREIDLLPKEKVTARLDYVGKGIDLLIQELKVPLIGFAGAPFTVASYLIEGKSSRDLKKTKQWMLRDLEGFHHLLNIITDHTIDYLNMQIERGVHALQIFDSLANVLAFEQFKEFSLSYLHKIMKGIKEIPIILFCRGSSVFAPLIAEISPNAIGIDWNADMAALRKKIPAHIALQGNLDPDILLYAPRQLLCREVNRLLTQMHQEPGYIFNLGHGILPDTPVDSVKALVECIKEKT